jgi:hypothetical protein
VGGGGRSRVTVVKAGVAQLVELQPSKLDVAGSNPVARSTSEGSRTEETVLAKAHVAQSAERVLGKDEVISSILIVGSTSRRRVEALGRE